MGTALGLFTLDETVVGVALLSIRRDLGLTIVESHWVVNIYLLVLSCLVAASGKLCDIIGFKRIFVSGILLFGAASVACGLAVDDAGILIARAAQGVGAAMIFPASMAMLSIVFPEEERGQAFGIYGAVGCSFMAAGPFVGGLLTEVASWRWIFWINPPVVLVAAAVVWRLWQDPPQPDQTERFDGSGLISLIGGLSLTIFAIMQGPELGWGNPGVWLTLLAGIGIFALFVVIELRVQAPLIDVGLFARLDFTTFNLMVFMGQFAKIAMLVILALYLQHQLGMSPLVAGIALLAGVAPQVFTAVLSGRITDRLGSRRPALWSLGISLALFLWLALAVTWNSYWPILPALVIWSLANCLVFVPALRGGVNCVPVDQQGQVGGIMISAQLLGGTVGMTLCGTLLTVTGSYMWAFLATAVLAAGCLVLAWLTIKEETPSESPGL